MRADVYLQAVLEKCESLTQSGLWAPSPYLRPKAWLANFKTDFDRVLAATLLDNFIYYSDRATDQLLRAAFAALEDGVLTTRALPPANADALLSTAVFTPIEGENPNRTDSGNLLCRRARNLLGIAESRVRDPKDALEAALQGQPVIFIDDFLGSGEQFIHTWERSYGSKSPASFKDAYALKPYPVFLLCLVATTAAVQRSTGAIPGLVVAFAHVLETAYSIHQLEAPPLHPPLDDFPALMADFLLRHSTALQLKSYMKKHDWPQYGLLRHGLLFAFEHSIPDATLPIFWASDGPFWVPLVSPR